MNFRHKRKRNHRVINFWADIGAFFLFWVIVIGILAYSQFYQNNQEEMYKKYGKEYHAVDPTLHKALGGM